LFKFLSLILSKWISIARVEMGHPLIFSTGSALTREPDKSVDEFLLWFAGDQSIDTCDRDGELLVRKIDPLPPVFSGFSAARSLGRR